MERKRAKALEALPGLPIHHTKKFVEAQEKPAKHLIIRVLIKCSVEPTTTMNIAYLQFNLL